MIITQTPYRISLFGGGTDYPEWYEQNGGLVVGMAINKYCHIGIKQTPIGQGVQYRIVYSKIEDRARVDDILHPAVRGVLKYMNPGCFVEMHHMGDLPAMGGMGASSSFVVGMLHALSVLMKNDPSEFSLASMATHVERHVIKESVGCQDQLFAAHGELNAIAFNSAGALVEKIEVGAEFRKELEDSLVLVHTGKHRFAHEMAAKVIESVPHVASTFSELRYYAELGLKAILMENLTYTAKLLESSWKTKRLLHSEISNPDIDALYLLGVRSGAIGGKLLGAGGGGFMLFIVAPERKEKFMERMNVPCITDLKISPYGSRVVLNQ